MKETLKSFAANTGTVSPTKYKECKFKIKEAVVLFFFFFDHLTSKQSIFLHVPCNTWIFFVGIGILNLQHPC